MVYIYFFDDTDESKNTGIPTFNIVDGYSFQFINISKDQANDILDNLDFESHVRLKSIADDLSKIFNKEIHSSSKVVPVKTDEELVSNQYLEVRLSEKYDKETDPIETKYIFYIAHYHDAKGKSDVTPYIQ